MTPEQFVDGLVVSVVDENCALYRDLLVNNIQAKDPYWSRAGTLFVNLSVEQQEVLLEIVRQASIDTISNVLGIIDGSSYLDGSGTVLELRGNGQDLSGDLQSLFLARTESGG